MYNNYFPPQNSYQPPYVGNMTVRNDNIQLARISGDIEFDFKTDANGNFMHQISKYGVGFTVYVDAYIMYPDAVYDIDVISSDGGGGHFRNIRANQHMKCTIETSFWHNTTITVKLHSSLPNSTGRAHIHYNT